MKGMRRSYVLNLLGAFTTLASWASATAITDIQGSAFLSPLNGKTVTNVQGIVTAKGTSGFWIQGPASSDIRVSNGVSVFTSTKTILSQVALGDMITLNGVVNEFHSSVDVLSVTEIDSPTNIKVLSSNNAVTPVVLGVDRIPPTQLYSALDTGSDGFLSVPSNVSQIETVNAALSPNNFGIDFFESLEGQLVTVPNPSVLNFPNSFGEIWVHGDWPVTGKNARGGLTLTADVNGIADLNPEVIIVGAPLDGTKNPGVAIGTKLSTITGVVHYQFGFYYVLPLTAPTVVTVEGGVGPTTISPNSTNPCVVALGDYNVDNLSPNVAHLPAVATHIAQFLRTPDLVHVQEIQDNDGSGDHGIVSANVTLQTLVNAIAAASGGVQYAFVDVDPVNDQDGGEPGGNIRQAYLYRPDRIKLAGNSPVGGSLDATAVFTDTDGKIGLTFNPGRIDPTNAAWLDSRKSLAAVWERVGGNGERLFTVNVHHTAKLGGTSEQGNPRPPVNEGVDQRTAQVGLVAAFVNSVLAKDASANVAVAGDFNEFVQTTSAFTSFTGILTEIDEVVGIPAVERYTFAFNMNHEQLDHIFISSAIALRPVQVEHVHVNQAAPNVSARASDHDPSVASIQLC
ncbi:DNase I-like protein [Hysterangium stoloniferum]|nr:DNase I-like protein [Hysterangium stoloniferum]